MGSSSSLPKTMTWSASRIVDRRWATTITVRPRVSSFMTAVIAASFSPSRAEVISSSSRMGASLIKARAMETRWRSPPDSFKPPCPTWVSHPSGRDAITWSSRAARAAASSSASVASGRAMRTFSRMVVSNRYTSWNTMEILRMSVGVGILRTSVPPICTEPESTSQNRAMSRSIVDLPQPEGPTSAVIVPCRAVKFTL